MNPWIHEANWSSTYHMTAGVTKKIVQVEEEIIPSIHHFFEVERKNILPSIQIVEMSHPKHWQVEEEIIHCFLLMEGIRLHQLIWRISHFFIGFFISNRWFFSDFWTINSNRVFSPKPTVSRVIEHLHPTQMLSGFSWGDVKTKSSRKSKMWCFKSPLEIHLKLVV